MDYNNQDEISKNSQSNSESESYQHQVPVQSNQAITQATLPQTPYHHPHSQTDTANKPGIIVLQWLTYAFWGWTIVSLGSLLATTLAHMITGAETDGFTPYGIAATLVLLPIAAMCDFFYVKHEPTKKTGAATIVMVIHAVLFALLGVCAIIGIVFSVIQLIISGSDTKAINVALITFLSLAILYAATFMRTINPLKLRWIRRAYLVFMSISVLAVIILSILGPLSYQRQTKNDRLISENIGDLVEDINRYANDKNSLPSSLGSIETSDNTEKLVASSLVQYTPNTKTPEPKNSSRSSYLNGSRVSQEKVFFYTLCANYKRASPGKSYRSSRDSINEYSEYISAYSHSAGKVCYKVATDYTD